MKFFSTGIARLFFACALASITTITQAEKRNSFGLGATYESGIYFGQDGYAEPFPFIDAEFGDFFIKNNVIGWNGYRGENIKIALIASQNKYFLDIEDINDASKDIYLGIENKDRAIEIGFLHTYYSPVGDIIWEYYKDISDAHGGMHNILRLARETGDPNNLTITPSVYVHYFSSAFNNYYYGISQAENELGREILRNRPVNPRELNEAEFEEFRPAFKGENSGHLGLDVWIKKAYTDNLIGVAYAAWEEVLGEVNRSSLVEDDARYTFRLGIEYRL